MRVSILILPLLAAPALADCDVIARREISVPAGGIARLNLETGAGMLKIVGVAGIDAIRAHGTACASSQRLLDQIKLTSQRSGNTAIIKTEMPDMDWFVAKTARLDLVVEVPSTMSVRADDSSGDVQASDLAAFSVEDGSGSLSIRNIRGALEVKDGSGDLQIENVVGNVTIDDGSGSIDVRKVGGNLSVEDGSGGIQIRKVRQNVTIDDSSGGINATDVGGDFTVSNDSSGRVNVAEIRGKVTIPRD